MTQTQKSRAPKLLAGAALLGLTACGGSSTPSVTLSNYQTISSTAVATSALAGVAMQVNGASGANTVVTSTGSLTHDSGATTINDGTYTLTDPNGATGSVLTDGTSVATISSLGANYEYLRTYSQSYAAGGVNYTTAGVSGVATVAGEMPTTGTATFAGQAEASLATPTSGFTMSSGTAAVTADFAAKTVGVTLNGFTTTDQGTGQPATAPLDTIAATGLAISGNGFSGSAVTTSLGGAAVDLTNAGGTGGSNAAQGNFFGRVASGANPDEVGGVILSQGSGGILRATFVGD